MFINYTSILPATRFEEDWTIRRKTNYLRTKNNPFFKQVYEATTINENSYINRYFKA